MSVRGYRVEGGHAVTWRGRLFAYGFCPSGAAWTRGPLDDDEDECAFRAFLCELRASGCAVRFERGS